MGANAQTTVPTFTLGQVLTADQMNQSARTGVPVFAGTTERDAAFGGSGEKTLAEGQLCYLESTNVVQYYDGSTWATVGPQTVTPSGLVRIGSTTLSSGTTQINNVFSSTYKNYRIVIDNAISSSRGFMYFRIGQNVSTGIYYYSGSYRVSSASTQDIQGNGATFIRLSNWEDSTASNIRAIGCVIDICNPYEALRTTLSSLSGGGSITASWNGYSGGVIDNTTSYTDFLLGTENGNFSAGTVTVYGYAAS